MAIPKGPVIREAEDLALAETLAPSRGANEHVADVTQSLPVLREPIVAGHFEHNYATEHLRERELGRGGIGRVVLVFDHTLGRDVAMKELLPELLSESESSTVADPAALTQRFLREARITGQLEHPNIVPVYELGRQPSGCLYYTMRVVRGRTLASAISSTRNTKERLALINHFAGLCQAIAYAHSRGVVHRDIKPENVMIGEFGETFVLDWGLAKVVDDDSPRSLRAAASLSEPPPSRTPAPALTPGTAETFHTQLGSIVGTPNYMSPEQLLQLSDGSSPTCDVWALGVVLHYILTGKLPFSAQNFGELLLKVTANGGTPTGHDLPNVPRDLAAIVARALMRDPRERYPSAREMARDIAAYQTGDKVAAYEYSSMELLKRFARRNLAVLAISTVAMLALVALGTSSYRRIVAARDAAVAAERRALVGEHRAKASLSDVLVERAKAELSEGNVASAKLLSAGAIELLERPDARGMLVAFENADRLESIDISSLHRECQKMEWNPTLDELGCLTSSSFTTVSLRNEVVAKRIDAPSIRSLQNLNSAGWLLIGDKDFVYRVAPNGTVQKLEVPLAETAVFAATPSGNAFAAADSVGNVTIWTHDSPTPLRHFRSTHATTAASFSQSEATLALGSYRGEIHIWNWRTDPTPKRLGTTHSTVRALALAPKGNALASGGADGSLVIWDLQQEQPQLLPQRSADNIVGLSYSPDGSQLACALRSGFVDILDARTHERAMRTATGFASIQRITFASDGLLVGIANGTIPLRYRIHRSTPRPRYASRGNVLSLAWASNDRDLLVAGLGEHGLCSLSLADGLCGDRLPIRTGIVRRVAYSHDRSTLVVAGTGGRVEVWEAKERLPRGYIDVPISEVRDVVFLPPNGRVVVAGNAPTLVTLDLHAMQVVDRETLPSPVQSLLVIDQQLAIGLRNGRVLLRSSSVQKPPSELAKLSGWPIGMGFSGRYGWFVVAEDNGRISLLDTRTKAVLDSLNVAGGRMLTFTFSDQLNLIAVAGEGRDVHLVSTYPKLSVIAQLIDHQGPVRTLLFDVKENRLFSAGDDGTIRLWQLGTLHEPPNRLRQAAEKQTGMHLESGRLVPSTPN